MKSILLLYKKYSGRRKIYLIVMTVLYARVYFGTGFLMHQKLKNSIMDFIPADGETCSSFK